MRIKSRKVTMESGVTINYEPTSFIINPEGSVGLLMYLGDDNTENSSSLYLKPNGLIFNDCNAEALPFIILFDEIAKWNKGE